METVLIILGVLGFGAVLISAYVFTVAARNYVSDKNYESLPDDQDSGERLQIVRSPGSRRYEPAANHEFPMTLPSGEVLDAERRQQGERRSLQESE